MKTRYAHTNIVARDWKALAAFYVEVFGCRPKPPERNLAGPWLDGLTGLTGARIRGMHLTLPGWGDQGPTLEIFQYDENLGNESKNIHTEGFGHIAFAVGAVVRSDIVGVGSLHVVYARDPEGNIVELQKWG